VAVRTDEEVWRRRAACRGPESTLFFAPPVPEPRPARDAREARAKRICVECTVREECLEYALRIREPHGIWGGLNEEQRRLLLERREHD
jgi:WhiB family redox-sensing transcriptional regulator